MYTAQAFSLYLKRNDSQNSSKLATVKKIFTMAHVICTNYIDKCFLFYALTGRYSLRINFVSLRIHSECGKMREKCGLE